MLHHTYLVVLFGSLTRTLTAVRYALLSALCLTLFGVCDAQDLHPNMGAVPFLEAEHSQTSGPFASSSGGGMDGYGAFNRFTEGETDFGFVFSGGAPPYVYNPILEDIDLSFYAGTYDSPGTLLALTGPPNAGGAVAGLYAINPMTGTATRYGNADPGSGYGWTGMELNPMDGKVNAIATDCAGSSALYTFSMPYIGGVPILVGDLTGGDLICPINLMINGSGKMYTLDVGLTDTNDFIYEITPILEAIRLINDVGFDAGFAQGASFNPIDGHLYLGSIRVTNSPLTSSGAPEGELRVLDEDVNGDPTGSSTLLGPFAPDGNVEANFLAFSSFHFPAVEPDVPDTYQLSEAYPNPFNPSSLLTLRLNRTEHVIVTVYDARGRAVLALFDGSVTGGAVQSFRIDAEGLTSGIYHVRFSGETFTDSRTVTLLR